MPAGALRNAGKARIFLRQSHDGRSCSAPCMTISSCGCRRVSRPRRRRSRPTSRLRSAGLRPSLPPCWSVDAESPASFLGPSPLLPPCRRSPPMPRDRRQRYDGRADRAAVCDRIHRDFAYDPEATTVNTTPGEAFELKRGVCQDFAHVMIVALRSLGIPRLCQRVPENPCRRRAGRLEGADAMHAWVRFGAAPRAAGWSLILQQYSGGHRPHRRRPWPRLPAMSPP
ncbi:hypothetical protein F2981_03400 [Sinorhizobium meliloti]|nr:hypothetical protein [Sinorhizobium meliloti]